MNQFHPNFNCQQNWFSHLSCSGVGWRAEVHPNSHPVSQLEFDVVIGADGRRNTLPGICKNTWSRACCDHRLSNQKCNKQMLQLVIGHDNSVFLVSHHFVTLVPQFPADLLWPSFFLSHKVAKTQKRVVYNLFCNLFFIEEMMIINGTS